MAARSSRFFRKSCTTLCFDNTNSTACTKALNIMPSLSLLKEGEASSQRSSPPSATRLQQRAGVDDGAAGGGGGVDRDDCKEGSLSVVGGGGVDDFLWAVVLNNVWLIVEKRFFCPGIARSSFFLPPICLWLPPKQITNKKIRADLPAGKKRISLQRSPRTMITHNSQCYWYVPM